MTETAEVRVELRALRKENGDLIDNLAKAIRELRAAQTRIEEMDRAWLNAEAKIERLEQALREIEVLPIRRGASVSKIQADRQSRSLSNHSMES